MREEIDLVKRHIRIQGFSFNEISDDFIENWFDYYKEKYNDIGEIADAIIGEYDLSVDDGR